MTPGTQLGSCEILSLLGMWGMPDFTGTAIQPKS